MISEIGKSMRGIADFEFFLVRISCRMVRVVGKEGMHNRYASIAVSEI